MTTKAQYKEIPLTAIQESPTNPRRRFDQDALEALAASIDEMGVQQPIVVRRLAGKAARYELVCGARRFRAAGIAGLVTIPAVVRDLDDLQVLYVQIVENSQREPVSPLDEAKAFEASGREPLEIADAIGRPLRYVRDRLRLRSLVEPLQLLLEADRIPLGAALRLASTPPDVQQAIVGETAEDGQAPFDRLHPSAIEGDGQPARWSRAQVDRHIDHHARLLGNARWPLDDATLGGHGACDTCPHRTSSQPDFWRAGDDRCLDGACFKAKGDAWKARHREEAEAAGYKVVNGWAFESRGGVRLEGALADVELPEHVQKTVHFEPSGNVVETAPREAVAAALEAAGREVPEWLQPRDDADDTRQQQLEDARKAREERERATMAAIIDAALTTPPPPPWDQWVDALLGAVRTLVRPDTIREALRFDGHKATGTIAELTKVAQEVVDNLPLAGRWALLVQLLAREGHSRTFRDEDRSWWRQLQGLAGLDVGEACVQCGEVDPPSGLAHGNVCGDCLNDENVAMEAGDALTEEPEAEAA